MEFDKEKDKSQKSYNSSMIIGLIDSCADIFNDSMEEKKGIMKMTKKVSEKEVAQQRFKMQSKVNIELERFDQKGIVKDSTRPKEEETKR